jgi:hypothetical protein
MNSHLKWTISLAGLLAGSPVAAQSELLSPASDSVEVEIAGLGTVEAPAQGYRINAFLLREVGGASVDVADIVRRLEELESVERKVCHPFSPLGFFGADLSAAGAEEEPLDVPAPPEDEAPEANPGDPEEGSDWAAYAPVSYSGLFASRAAVDSVRAVLRERGQRPATVQPVLFDCTAASEQARLAALRDSLKQVTSLAAALGMNVAGITRIAAANDDANLLVMSALSQMTNRGVNDTVEVQVPLRVTYRLER